MKMKFFWSINLCIFCCTQCMESGPRLTSSTDSEITVAANHEQTWIEKNDTLQNLLFNVKLARLYRQNRRNELAKNVFNHMRKHVIPMFYTQLGKIDEEWHSAEKEISDTQAFIEEASKSDHFRGQDDSIAQKQVDLARFKRQAISLQQRSKEFHSHVPCALVAQAISIDDYPVQVLPDNDTILEKNHYAKIHAPVSQALCNRSHVSPGLNRQKDEETFSVDQSCHESSRRYLETLALAPEPIAISDMAHIYLELFRMYLHGIGGPEYPEEALDMAENLRQSTFVSQHQLLLNNLYLEAARWHLKNLHFERVHTILKYIRPQHFDPQEQAIYDYIIGSVNSSNRSLIASLQKTDALSAQEIVRAKFRLVRNLHRHATSASWKEIRQLLEEIEEAPTTAKLSLIKSRTWCRYQLAVALQEGFGGPLDLLRARALLESIEKDIDKLEGNYIFGALQRLILVKAEVELGNWEICPDHIDRIDNEHARVLIERLEKLLNTGYPPSFSPTDKKIFDAFIYWTKKWKAHHPLTNVDENQQADFEQIDLENYFNACIKKIHAQVGSTHILCCYRYSPELFDREIPFCLNRLMQLYCCPQPERRNLCKARSLEETIRCNSVVPELTDRIFNHVTPFTHYCRALVHFNSCSKADKEIAHQLLKYLVIPKLDQLNPEQQAQVRVLEKTLNEQAPQR